MNIFSYYDTEIWNNTEIVDIFKNLELDITTEDYNYHAPTENENLMLISFKYYDTIDNWWIIYLFNYLFDVNFSIINSNTINTTSDYYTNILDNFNNSTEDLKGKLIEIVRNYYLFEGDDLKTSIIKTNNSIKDNNNTFQNNISLYIKNELIKESYLTVKLKIPSNEIVFDIKNKLEVLTVYWKDNK
jgi:hypothetical protein